jgi:hypothetical protein
MTRSSLLVTRCSDAAPVRPVQSIDELAHSRGARAEFVVGDQRAGEASFYPMLKFVGRTSSDQEEAFLVHEGATANRLSHIGRDGVGRAEHLNADGPLIERRPSANGAAQIIGEFHGKPVCQKVFKARHPNLSCDNAWPAPRETRNEKRGTR